MRVSAAQMSSARDPSGPIAAWQPMHWPCPALPMGWTSCCWWEGCTWVSIRRWMKSTKNCNETVYVVRDALTGRVLSAEQVNSSETEAMKALLAPVVALDARVLGTISDAQESELLALEQLWPEVPHQVCQFHALRDASQLAFEAD